MFDDLTFANESLRDEEGKTIPVKERDYDLLRLIGQAGTDNDWAIRFHRRRKDKGAPVVKSERDILSEKLNRLNKLSQQVFGFPLVWHVGKNWRIADAPVIKQDLITSREIADRLEDLAITRTLFVTPEGNLVFSDNAACHYQREDGWRVRECRRPRAAAVIANLCCYMSYPIDAKALGWATRIHHESGNTRLALSTVIVEARAMLEGLPYRILTVRGIGYLLERGVSEPRRSGKTWEDFTA